MRISKKYRVNVEPDQLLGSGSFGVVRTCSISRFDLGIFGEKEKFAIKIMNKQAILQNEIYTHLLNGEM
tara:strand:+ start:284 stop:490 length:207 start_codon:yes stop_codon:yes gene_type:complete